MARHFTLMHICKDFRKTRKRFREIIESDDENLVKKRFKDYKRKVKDTYNYFVRLLLYAKDLYWQAKYLQEEIADLEKTRNRCYDEIKRYQAAKAQRFDAAYFSKEEEKKVREEVKRKQAGLVVKQKKVEKLEQEYIIKQEELEIAIKDTNLAKSSYYHLSETEINLFENEREHILKGIEKWGSISLACQNNAKITMRPSSIMHYAAKHSQFREDVEIAKKVFKDRLDAELLDRALNGTRNPVFQKGEYIGDYAVKDNKLLVEVAKAKLPETYNPKAYQAAHPQAAGGTTINILSFDGVDETKKGYARNIGVVKSVDESGRVERITQAKKMIDFYKDKPGAQIIKAEATQSPLEEVIDAEVINIPEEDK